MWRALTRKALADVRSRPLETITLAAVAGIGAATLLLALLVSRSTRDSYDRFIEDAGAGHAWFFSDNRQHLVEISRLPEVVQYGELVPALDAGRSLSTAEPYSLSFFAVDDSPPQVSPAVLTAGAWPASGGGHEAVIDPGMAREAGIGIGDALVVSARGGTAELRIVGLAIPTSRPPYPISQTTRVFISSANLEELSGGAPAYYALGVRLADPEAAREFISRAQRSLATNSPPVARTWLSIQDSIAEELSETWVLLWAFSIFVLIGAAVVVVNTVAARSISYGWEIAVLKAFGMTPAQIGALLVGQSAILAAFAALGGVVAGWYLMPLLVGDVRDALGVAVRSSLTADLVLIPVGIVVGVVALGSVLPAAAAARLSVAKALSGQSAQARTRKRSFLRIFGRSSSPTSIGIASVFSSSRVRSSLTIAAVAIASAAVVGSLVMRVSFEHVVNEPESIGVLPIDLEVEPLRFQEASGFAQITEAELTALVAGLDGLDAYVNRLEFSSSVDGMGVSGNAIGGDIDRIGFNVVDGRLFEGEDEAIIGLGLARATGLEPGDTLRFHTSGPDSREFTIPVVGIYIEDRNDGRAFAMDIENVRSQEGDLPAGTFNLRMEPDTDLDRVSSELSAASGGRIVIRDVHTVLTRAVAETSDAVMPALNGLMGLMIGLALVSLGGTLVKSVHERRREIGILKTVGFTPSQVLRSVVSGAVVFVLLGTVIGAPLGWVFVRLMVDGEFEKQGYDAGAIVQIPGAGLVALALLGAIAVALAASAIPAWRAATTRVADSMRYE